MMVRWWIASLTALAVVFVVSIIYWAVTDDQKRETACKEKGGIHFSPRNGSICLRPEAVILLDSK